MSRRESPSLARYQQQSRVPQLARCSFDNIVRAKGTTGCEPDKEEANYQSPGPWP
jgi:hypothetical protein